MHFLNLKLFYDYVHLNSKIIIQNILGVENRFKNQMLSEMRKNTFYEGSPQQMGNQQDQKNKESTKQLIWRSKRLIQQIENNKSLKSIKSINSSSSINGQNRKLTTKQKIESSIKNIKNNPTIAEELLSNQNQEGGAYKKQNYMNVIQQVYAKSKRKKRTRREEEQSSPQQKRRKKRPSYIPLSLNTQIQKEIIQKVGVMGSKNYINDDDINEQKKNRKENKQLGRLYQQEVEQIENIIQSSTSIPKTQNEKRRKGDNYETRQGDLSIIMRQEEGKQELYDIQLSSSSQSSNAPGKKNQSEGDHLKKMQMEIDKEINNLKIQSKKKIGSAQKIQLKTRVPSGQSSDEQKMRKQNKERVISFRQQYQNSPKFRQIEIPKEQLGEDIANRHIHHNDYGISIEQSKIVQVLNTIQRRIKYSTVVIDQVYYEHCIREDNNQMQIDNRFAKETKQRLELMKKIQNYVTQNKKYHRYSHYNHSNKYRNRNINNSALQHRYPFKFDLFGNKKLYYDSQIWKSPGVSPSREKFISLNSPLKNNEQWFQNTQDSMKIVNVDSKLRHLLMCRSAETFATLNSIPTHNRSKFNKNKYFRNRNSSKSSSDYSSFNDFRSKSKSHLKHKTKLSQLQKKQSQKVIKQSQWNRIQQIRKKINQNEEDL